jgi:CRISP-associated protein Cas1
MNWCDRPTVVERHMLGEHALRREGSRPFAFDMMEPERPKVDRAVLDFVKVTVFDPADFTIRNHGVVRLNPHLARHVVGLC